MFNRSPDEYLRALTTRETNDKAFLNNPNKLSVKILSSPKTKKDVPSFENVDFRQVG
ncbi:MAG: hypothetical protein QW815_01055 [Nitrososphaerota archaeon]